MWRLCTFLVALASVLASVSAAPADSFDVTTCTYMSPATGTSFDMSTLALPVSDSYTIRDPYATGTPGTFYFNVCENTRKPAGELCTGGDSSAFLLSADRSSCTSMGLLKGAKMSLVDSSEPMTGVDITYGSGQKCPGSKKSASFSLRLLCAPTASAGVKRIDTVAECSFRATIAHPRACPRECPVSDRGICNGNGLCRLDTDAHASRCFCNSGFFGPGCTSPTNPSSDPGSCTGTCAALAIVLVFLVVALAGAALLLWRIKRMERMPVVFQSGFRDPREYAGVNGDTQGVLGERGGAARAGRPLRSDE